MPLTPRMRPWPARRELVEAESISPPMRDGRGVKGIVFEMGCEEGKREEDEEKKASLSLRRFGNASLLPRRASRSS